MHCIYRTRVKNELPALKQLATALERELIGRNIPEQIVFEINLCLEEILTNIIQYGFPDGRKHEIDVALSLHDSVLTITIIDAGAAFDPTRPTIHPDIYAELSQRDIGGLGLHIVHEMMDEVRYERKRSQNRLTLKKIIDFFDGQ
jgi:serine/threonine-protein kinase RsbW